MQESPERLRNLKSRFILFALLIVACQSGHAHLLGIAWDHIGDHTVRFYGETAHNGLTGPAGGALQIGPWASREYYEWTGIINGTTFEELGIDGMAYWSFDDPNSTLNEGNYESHAVPPGTYGNFFFVDVPNFVSGEYLLTAEDRLSAVDRPLAYNTYLTAYISVPEPSVFALCAMGLLGSLVPPSRRRFPQRKR